jgi:hypothetical protein
MQLPTEKVEDILLEYHSMHKLESSHMRACFVCTLPFSRPRANCRRFAMILKMLLYDSETTEQRNPTEILHSISLCRNYRDFKDLV